MDAQQFLAKQDLNQEIIMKDLASLSGWDMAKELGCHYNGDGNPLCGGYFYNLRDWENGYTNVVNIYPHPDDRSKVVVEMGSINKATDEDIKKWVEENEIDVAFDLNDKHLQVEASFQIKGVDPDAVNAWRYYDRDNEELLWEEMRTELSLQFRFGLDEGGWFIARMK